MNMWNKNRFVWPGSGRWSVRLSKLLKVKTCLAYGIIYMFSSITISYRAYHASHLEICLVMHKYRTSHHLHVSDGLNMNFIGYEVLLAEYCSPLSQRNRERFYLMWSKLTSMSPLIRKISSFISTDDLNSLHWTSYIMKRQAMIRVTTTYIAPGTCGPDLSDYPAAAICKPYSCHIFKQNL